MKMIYFLYLLLFTWPLTVFCQTTTRTVSKVNLSTENNRWDLNKYVWSQSRIHPNSKPPLDFAAIDGFMNLGSDVSVTGDGKFFVYTINKGRRVDSVVIQSTVDSWRKAFKSNDIGFFSGDNKKYIFLDDSGLHVFKIGSEEEYTIKDVVTYKLPKNENKEWLACCFNNKELILLNLYDGREKKFSQVLSYDFDPSGQWLIMESGGNSNNKGLKQIVVCSLSGNREKIFSGVKNYQFHAGGRSFILETQREINNAEVNELQLFDLVTDSLHAFFTIADSTINIKTSCIDNTGSQVAFVVEMVKGAETQLTLLYWKLGRAKPEIMYNDFSPNINQNLGLCFWDVSFSENDLYILFSLQPKRIMLSTTVNDVSMDIWSFKDNLLQFSGPQKTPRIYKALVNVETGKLFQLENEYEHIKCLKGDFTVVCKSGHDVYAERFWEKGYGVDSNWLVCLRDASRKSLPMADKWTKIWFSPGGHYLLCYDNSGNYFSYFLSTGRFSKILANKKSKNGGDLTGIALWLPGDTTVWVYDHNDIYQLDLRGKTPPVNLTNGYGQQSGTIFSLLNRGHGEAINADISPYLGKDTLLLRAFNKKSKFNGFYRKILGQTNNPEPLFMGPCFMTSLAFVTNGLLEAGGMVPLKAANANLWIVSKQTPSDAPNYFVTMDFKSFRRLTNLQPQIDYNWLTTELHTFKQLNGTISQGVLYKPENFDPSKKYPVIITFYTNLSDRLYQYPKASYLNQPSIFDQPAWMVSHGYLVFAPDIYFGKKGWGPSTVNTLDGAAKYLGELPYVDKKHIGAAGHSNSGRFGYYLYTHSKSFAAIALGSGSGGIDPIGIALTEGGWLEWGERGSVGGGLGNLWTNKAKWIDHIALMQLDKASSPLLCFFNKKDWFGARQAEQLLIGLRRLEKAAWWLQYDNQGHILTQTLPMKDFTLRYTQFFDHYLKEAPAPQWMTKGILTAMKGIETGYELDLGGNCGLKVNKCKVCNKWNEQFRKTSEMFSKP